MIKLVGAILTIGATSRLGFIFAARLERRKNTLIGFKDALSLLESEIGFAQNSLCKAFYNISRTIPPPVGSFFSDIYEKLSEGADTCQTWEKTLARHSGALCLTGADIDTLVSFAARLGRSDTENELKNICNTMVRLNIQIADAKNICDTNKKVCQSAGVLCGVLIAVLMI